MKQLFINMTNFLKNGCSVSNEQFPRLYPGLEMAVERKSAHKDLFLFLLREMDEKLEVGGTIDYGDLSLEDIFFH